MSQQQVLETRDLKLPSSMPPPPLSNGLYGRQLVQDGPQQNLIRAQNNIKRDNASERKQPEFPPLPNLQGHPKINSSDKNKEADVHIYDKRNETQNFAQTKEQEFKTQLSSSENSRILNEVKTVSQQESQDHKINDIPQMHESIYNVKQNITDKSSDKSTQDVNMKDNDTVSAERKRKHSSSRRKKDRKRSRSSKRDSRSKHRKRSHHKHRDIDSRKHHGSSRHHRDKKRQESTSNYKKCYRRHSSSNSRSSSSSSSKSKSSSNKRRRNEKKPQDKKVKTVGDVHPYFQRKKEQEEEQAKLFWDGFQWVTRQQQIYDIAQNAAERAQKAVTGEDQQKNEERIAASKTVIIENIALDLGLTAKDIQKFLYDKLESLGEKDVDIVDIDMSHGTTSISVELSDKSQVEKLKKLDGVPCLGEKLKVRKVNEETAQTNATAAAITLAALKSLTSGSDEAELNLKAGTLKTVNVSSVLKVSNIFDRDEIMTAEVYEDLYEDMEAEFVKIPHLKRIKVVRNGEERLGAEVGCVFVEFRDKKSAEIGLKIMKGRIYDGREIKVCYVDEQLYYNELYIP